MCFSTMSTLMSTSLRRGCCLISAAALITLLTLTQRPLAASDDATEVNSLAQYYGFSGMELFKVDRRAFNLVSGDFTGDGLNDVMFVDNRGSAQSCSEGNCRCRQRCD